MRAQMEWKLKAMRNVKVRRVGSVRKLRHMKREAGEDDHDSNKKQFN